MGISKADLRRILKLREDGILPAKFNVAELGAQQLGNDTMRDSQIFEAYAQSFGLTQRIFGSVPVSKDKTMAADAPSAKDFWEWLGCGYAAIDVDGSPHALPLDLNFDEVPAEHRGKYHLVTNFGTTEHTANQIQAMKIVHDLTAVGGVMMHNVPAQGYSNHGVINYNPKFFWLLSRGCRYHWLDMVFSRESIENPICPDIVAEVARFNPQSAEELQNYRVSDAWFVALMQKREDIPFVPPIDVGLDAVMADARLRARYTAG